MPIGYITDKKTVPVNKFGFNNDVDTVASEDIWSAGGLYPYDEFTTAQSLEFLSSSIEDAPGLTGTEEITIIGLDANKEEQTVTIATNGTNAVSLSGTWLAVNRAYINDNKTGSNGSNVGNINIRIAGAGAIVSQIPADRGQTQQCVYRVPEGYQHLKIKNIIAYTDAAVGKTASMQLIQIGDDCVTTRILSSGTLTESSSWSRTYEAGGKKIPPGNWVAVRALSVAQNDTAITADFDGELE